jgi:hypothetical protein
MKSHANRPFHAVNKIPFSLYGKLLLSDISDYSFLGFGTDVSEDYSAETSDIYLQHCIVSNLED